MENYQSYLKVNLDYLENNLREIKKLGKLTKIAGVVKANAYGLGSVNISRALEKMGLDYFCVSTFYEAKELRDHGIYTPILVLSSVDDDYFEEAIKKKIEITIFQYDIAFKLNEIAKRLGLVVNIHIKLDTGMGRIGFRMNDKHWTESLEEIRKINALSNVRIQGIYSHLSDADGENYEYTRYQYHRFLEFLNQLDQMGIRPPIKHLANDAGAILHGLYLDMIRVGIGLYGYYSSKTVEKSHRVNLKPVASLVSRIHHIKWIEKEDAIGYNRTFLSPGRRRVATVSIGYADGIPYNLSNAGEVFVKGVRCPIIGKVCMDQLMIDVTEVEEVELKDEVLIFGEDEYGEIPLKELAEISQTIVYDILTKISMRIPRIYYYRGKVIKELNYLTSFDNL